MDEDDLSWKGFAKAMGWLAATIVMGWILYTYY